MMYVCMYIYVIYIICIYVIMLYKIHMYLYTHQHIFFFLLRVPATSSTALFGTLLTATSTRATVIICFYTYVFSCYRMCSLTIECVLYIYYTPTHGYVNTLNRATVIICVDTLDHV